jgi:DNA invertase Pin-like site-specific DNA recombinase
MLIGYARVSTDGQNLDRQIDQLVEYGVDKRNIYKEKQSGKKARPELKRLIDELQEGDTVVVCDLTRVSRSTKDLLSTVELITKKKANIKSIKDVWLDTTSDNPYNSFLLTVMSALAQLEADLVSSRVKEGLASAKKRGRVGGRPSKQNKHAEEVIAMFNGGMKKSKIVEATGLSRSTINRIINNNNI